MDSIAGSARRDPGEKQLVLPGQARARDGSEDVHRPDHEHQDRHGDEPARPELAQLGEPHVGGENHEQPLVRLGIKGRGEDGWYSLSTLSVVD